MTAAKRRHASIVPPPNWPPALPLRHQHRVHLTPLRGLFVSQGHAQRRSLVVNPAEKTYRTRELDFRAVLQRVVYKAAFHDHLRIAGQVRGNRSEEHTSELQSPMY